ncbi:MAG TPA: hypothetical protein PLP63_06460 [Saprospiraceae bacterium]|nr:hypothetical protein [Saprospiraceae bacterium]
MSKGIDYCEPGNHAKKSGIIGVHRSRKTKKNHEIIGIESNGKDYLRVYMDDIDGGFDTELPESLVKKLFRDIKKNNAN